MPYADGLFTRATPTEDTPMNVSFVDADTLDAPSMESLKQRAQQAPVIEPPQEPPKPEPRRRQLVEAAPTDEQRPDDADYLAEQDSRVDKETRTEKFKINPEVLAPTYSNASSAVQKAAEDKGTRSADGAPAAGAPDAGRSGAGPPRSLLPERWQPTSVPGRTTPTEAGVADIAGFGAPQNDLLGEAVGDAVALNTLAFAGAKYLNQVRRHVNFYWSQQIDNLPRSLGLSRPVYETQVSVVLDRDGALEAFAVTEPSGNGMIDDCIRKAFTMSAPYGAPPPEILGADGRLRLPDFAFTLEIVREARR
ncbi:MAG: TonB C-terminal domain-containing protein [Pseudomonadota bacterium]|nr:TonB C-terminal domain-containing protein [Pseudomonadota bacterium]